MFTYTEDVVRPRAGFLGCLVVSLACSVQDALGYCFSPHLSPIRRFPRRKAARFFIMPVMATRSLMTFTLVTFRLKLKTLSGVSTSRVRLETLENEENVWKKHQKSFNSGLKYNSLKKKNHNKRLMICQRHGMYASGHFNNAKLTSDFVGESEIHFIIVGYLWLWNTKPVSRDNFSKLRFTQHQKAE